MRFWGLLAVFAAIVCLFASGAFAAIEGFPSTLDFYNKQQTITFRVSNTADSAKRVSVEFLSPMDANIAAPVSIAGKGDANVSITLYPTEGLIGQNYESTLVVRVGEEETRKVVKIFFNPAKPAGFGGIDSNALNVSGLVGFFSTPNTELALTIVLAIIAAILLIAFIARLVRRFQG